MEGSLPCLRRFFFSNASRPLLLGVFLGGIFLAHYKRPATCLHTKTGHILAPGCAVYTPVWPGPAPIVLPTPSKVLSTGGARAVKPFSSTNVIFFSRIGFFYRVNGVVSRYFCPSNHGSYRVYRFYGVNVIHLTGLSALTFWSNLRFLWSDFAPERPGISPHDS